MNVDETCRALSRNLSTAVKPPVLSTNSSANATFGNFTGAMESMVGDYTHISPSIGVDLNLFAQLAMELDGPGDLLDFDMDKSTDYTVFGTKWALPTVCIDNSPATSTTAAASTTSAMTCIEDSPAVSTTAGVHVTSAASELDVNRLARQTMAAASLSTAVPLPLPTNGAEMKGPTGSGMTVALLIAVAWAVTAV